jgi:GDPmannose 4,6-dehydratase
VDERGYVRGTERCLIEVDPRYFRPTEVDLLLGDPTKAEKELGWRATTTLEEMILEMVNSDIKEHAANSVHQRDKD